MAARTVEQVTSATTTDEVLVVPLLLRSSWREELERSVTSYTFFWLTVLIESPSMVLSADTESPLESPSTLMSLERLTTATIRPALPIQERTSNATIAMKPFWYFDLEARSSAVDLAIAHASFSSMIPSPLGSMRRISVSCAGVRVEASRSIEGCLSG